MSLNTKTGGVQQGELFYSNLEVIRIIIPLIGCYCFPVVDFRQKEVPATGLSNMHAPKAHY